MSVPMDTTMSTPMETTVSTNESRIEKLRQVLKRAKELAAQNRSLRQEDLDLVRELWQQQEEILQEALRSKNQSVQEMILDLQIIYSTNCYIGQHIRELQTTVKQFNSIDYAEKLVAKFTENGELDWSKISDDAVRIINRAPGIPTLLGTFGSTDVEIKKVADERKKPAAVPRVPKVKEVIAEKQTASKVENLSEDKDSVDIKVNHIKSVLQRLFKGNNNRPINFYKFVLHPFNFTATVENIFYISFIIRDGHARLGSDGNDELVISPLQKEVKTERPEAKNQMVFSITMEEWRSLVTNYDVREPLIEF